VGRKTANVVLNVAFGEPTIAVDTHIFRVANRTGLAPGKDVFAVEQGLEASTPDEFRRQAHHWLILHGRYICVARAPKCPECVIRDLCEYPAKTAAPLPRAKRPAVEAPPNSASRTAPVPRHPRGAQPMAKAARAGARRGRAR
jgi:endonuclease-3